jgi:hypothetical protein
LGSQGLRISAKKPACLAGIKRLAVNASKQLIAEEKIIAIALSRKWTQQLQPLADMGRELQKKKNRSSNSKVKRRSKSRRVNILGNPIVAANW